MNSEINRNSIEIHTPTSEGYRDVKPRTGLSVNEANSFWNSELTKASGEYKSQRRPIRETDDNGIQFRDGDKLLPNTTFEVNKYTYETDEQGRVISASGKLYIRDANYVRNTEKVRNKEGQEYNPTDDEGHLIAHQFGGSDSLENLVPQDSRLNQKDYANMENELARHVKAGAEVQYKVQLVYEGNSNRPSEFHVTYSIDGDRNVRVFRNGGDN